MRVLDLAFQTVGALLFVTMFACFIVQITGRYLLARPVPWAGEIAVLCFIWFVFWYCAVILTKDEHIRVDILYQLLPDGARRVARMLSLVVTGGIFAAALPGTADYLLFLNWQQTPILRLGFGYAYAVILLFMAAHVLSAVLQLWRLSRSGWRRELT